MVAQHDIEIELPDAEATRAFAVRIAPGFKAGQLIVLSGPIGAGKTEFARAVIQSRAGREIEVPSPSFTLVQTYRLSDINIAHIDLYRLADPSELVELGLEDLFTDHLCLVEWAERAEGSLPAAAMALDFALQGNGRRLRINDSCGAFRSEASVA